MNKPLKRLPTRALSRSLSLFNFTVKAGAKLATRKLSELLVTAEKRQGLDQEFFSEQATQLVKELGRLKGSIMKAGQMLSVYGEHFFPKEVNEILRMLQSDSRPVVWEEMHRALKQQLGTKLDELEIEPHPIAAASMGQVYRATIKATGEVLALKIQYPGIDKAIDSDLKALKIILRLTQLSENSAGFTEIFKEIRMMLHYEVDYQRERDMLKQYRTWIGDDPRYKLPRVYDAFSTGRVLAMSYEEGNRVSDPAVMNLSQERRNRLGAAIMDLLLKEIFVWQTVQTDPHMGNFKILLGEDGMADRLVLLDFGATRKFANRYIDPFRLMVRSSLLGDREGVWLAAYKLGFLLPEDADAQRDLFARLCFTAVEPFSESCASPSLDASELGDRPYHWHDQALLDKLALLTKDAVFTFKLRPPPREAVFLDRKLVGVYTFIKALDVRFGPRKLLMHYVQKP